MTSVTLQHDSVGVDWETAVAVAEGLGRATLIRVAQRDADAVQEWAMTMARAYVGEREAIRGLSYLELAVLCGYTGAKAAELRARLDWDDLLQRAERLTEDVRRRAAEHEAAMAALEEDQS